MQGAPSCNGWTFWHVAQGGALTVDRRLAATASAPRSLRRLRGGGGWRNIVAGVHQRLPPVAALIASALLIAPLTGRARAAGSTSSGSRPRFAALKPQRRGRRRRLCRGRSRSTATPFSHARRARRGGCSPAASTPPDERSSSPTTKARARPTGPGRPRPWRSRFGAPRKSWTATKTCSCSTVPATASPDAGLDYKDEKGGAAARFSGASWRRCCARLGIRNRLIILQACFCRAVHPCPPGREHDHRHRRGSRSYPRSAARPGTTGPSSATP